MVRRRLHLAMLVLLLSFALSTVATQPVEATVPSDLVLEATFTTVDYGWEKVERWLDQSSLFQAEDYLADGRNDQTGQRKTFFGTARPFSGRFLLYYAPGWDTGSKPVPVLLVHGALHNADWAWAKPDLGGCGNDTCPSTGLMQYLVSKGYKVFAINFPHMHGDNYYWAKQIYDAIEIIKDRTGASQVDVIAHSKGGFAARQYVSSVYKSGGVPYAGNVRKLILVGTPNKGIDYTFRHGILPSVASYPECGYNGNYPAAHTWLVCYGWWYSHPELTIYTTSSGNYFPGQKQMLYRWDGVYGLSVLEQDWYTTYYGGWGYVSYSPGIQTAINQGSLVSTIRNAGIPATVQTYLLCGDTADIPEVHNEHTGPSDGVIFLASCGDTGGIGNVAGQATLHLNHLELVWHTLAADQIEAWLSQ